MKVTKTEEHGLRLAMALAREYRQLTIADLSQREGLSEALIAKLLGMLRRGGVVKAERGRKGGYELAAPPETISVADVIKTLGPALFRGCLESGVPKQKNACTHTDDCGLRSVWDLLEERITQVLDRISLAGLVEREEEVRRQVTALWPRPD